MLWRALHNTYIATWEGWAYLATVIDLASRRVVGWAMADHMRAELACDALAMAIAARRPGPGHIFHSDYAGVFVKPKNGGLACCGRGLSTASSA